MPLHAGRGLSPLLVSPTLLRRSLARVCFLTQATSSRTKFETEIDSKNTQLKHFRDEVEDMMVAIEVMDALKPHARVRTSRGTLTRHLAHADMRWWLVVVFRRPAICKTMAEMQLTLVC